MDVTDNSSQTQSSHEDERKGRRCCRHGPRAWCKAYFWEGQELNKPMSDEDKEHIATLSRGKRFLVTHRRMIGFCAPGLFFHFFWWGAAIQHDLWGLFVENYPMTITMVFGSMFAGMTSVGGGAVAFPVMTLALSIDPTVSRDFVLMIQSVGMTSASFTIFFMRVCVEWPTLICCSLGGIGGIIFGLHVIDPNIPSSAKKLGFVSIWFAFACVLIFLNRTGNRRTYSAIQHFNWWRLLTLIFAGFVGGAFSSFSGSGLDITSFMILTLLFRVSEKVATPTSVICMAFNSLVGFYWRAVMMEAVSQEAVNYWLVCIPVVVIGAPLGSLLGSHFHRLVLAGLVVFLNTFALVSAYAIVDPLTAPLIGGCMAVMVGCFGIFMALTYAGYRLMKQDKLNDLEIVSTTSVSTVKDNHILDIGYDNSAYVGENSDYTKM